MSKKINAGGPAFPLPANGVLEEGLSIRDYFAAKAMQGLIAGAGDADGVVTYEDRYVAESAYAMADAMLKARQA